jgi:predicted dienelactone hydrolase
VGSRTESFADEARATTLRTEIWYPAVAGTGTDPVFAFSTAEVEADLAPERERWPLVLFSHGFGGARWQSSFLTEHLASRGYVVVAPDHPENNIEDGVDEDPAVVARVAWNRPLDISFVLDAAQTLPSWHPLAGRIDAARPVAIGHSFGAWTVLALAGATVTASLDGGAMPGVPDPPWRLADPRIAAIVALTPGGARSFGDGLDGIGIPALFVGSRLDETLPYLEEARALWDACPGDPRLLTLERGGHMSPTDLCRILPQFGDGCGDGFVEPETAHALLQEVVTAYVDRHALAELRGEAWLEPGRLLGLEATLE